MTEPLLNIKDLEVTFSSDGKDTAVVEGVSFHINAGETLGIVGESGCGKSVTSLSIMRLIPSPPGKIANGQILFEGEDLLGYSEKKMRSIRGNTISMIFQEPMTSLNPVFTIGRQIDEVLLLHNKLSTDQARKRSVEMLKMVGIPRAEKIYSSYPFELSGGMRQRVMIAIGLACQPRLLIADEPTTALDVTIQAQILDLMQDLKERTNTAIMFITHDLGVVAEMCDRVVVMYAGQVVESTDVDTLFNDPKHPYTKGLLSSIPNVTEKIDRLEAIPGQVPQPGSIEQGCRFRDRCSEAFDRCEIENPELLPIKEGHQCRCWLYTEEKEELRHGRNE